MNKETSLKFQMSKNTNDVKKIFSIEDDDIDDFEMEKFEESSNSLNKKDQEIQSDMSSKLYTEGKNETSLSPLDIFRGNKQSSFKRINTILHPTSQKNMSPLKRSNTNNFTSQNVSPSNNERKNLGVNLTFTNIESPPRHADDSIPIDITKNFDFGQSEPRNIKGKQENDILDNKSFQDFSFPPKQIPVKVLHNRISDLKLSDSSFKQRGSIGTISPVNKPSSPSRKSMYSPNSNLAKQLPGTFKLDLDNMIDRLDEDEELDFMIDVSYVLTYVSETLVRNLKSVGQYFQEYDALFVGSVYEQI